MDFLTLLIMALGLSMDAFAVSVSNSMCFKGLSLKKIALSAATFGVFQGVMPIVGFFAGQLLGGTIEAIDHWVAVVLLGIIGGKMLWEGIRALRRPDECPAQSQYTIKAMLVQALATSIDALAVGISLAALSVNIWFSASIIAGITFACCVVGGFLGRRFGALLGDWAQIFGGAILVFIGLKIFLEHMLG